MTIHAAAVQASGKIIESIDDVMRTLAAERPPASLFFGHYRHYLLSDVAGVDEKRKRVLLSCTTSSSLDRRLLHAGQALVETRWNGLLIKFHAQYIVPELFENRPVFSASYPDTVSMVREREEYRFILDEGLSFACHVRDGMQNIQTRVADISIGGIGLLADVDEPVLQAGRTYRNCQLRVPNAAPVTLPFRVLHSEMLSLDGGREMKHYSCALVGNNPRNDRQLLQLIIDWQHRHG